MTRSAGARASRSVTIHALVPLVALVVLVAASCSKNPDANPSPNESTPSGTTASGAPSFDLPEDPGNAMRAANLHEIPNENVKALYRAHVDVIVNDKPVTIPAGLGVGTSATSPVTTTDASGVVHINVDGTVEEQPDDKGKPMTFRVGQLFAQWDVRLDKSCLATYCNDDDHQLLGFVNGQLVADPASIPFHANDQIVVWYGPKGSNPQVPASYAFPTP